MKKRWCILSLFVSVICTGCLVKGPIGQEEKEAALADFKACNAIADTWLTALDSSGYRTLMSLESYNRVLSEKKIEEIISHYNGTFGRVADREFLGAHFWDGRDLITWAPNIGDKHLAHIKQERSDDGFYRIPPHYFGHMTPGGMFRGFPEGRYVLLLFKSVPANKSYAEEVITFRKPKDGDWRIHGYDIDDEV